MVSHATGSISACDRARQVIGQTEPTGSEEGL
jgi:hypothetical protein